MVCVDHEVSPGPVIAEGGVIVNNLTNHILASFPYRKLRPCIIAEYLSYKRRI